MCKDQILQRIGSYDKFPIVKSNDLWIKYSPTQTQWRIWSPTASAVILNIYKDGESDNLIEKFDLNPAENGTWHLRLKGDFKNRYYTYQVKINGKNLDETPGIYATAVGINGKRAMVCDLESTNPSGWNSHERPELHTVNDILIYELHVRDMTMHTGSGSGFPGKFKGLVERGTKNKWGQSTGIDHMKELGITHVHLLPVFDYHSIDEKMLSNSKFNWGYDPKNYNVPEGSYSTNPYNANVRIREFKEMVMGFHEYGIRVIMDVVYNHTAITEKSGFNLEVPGYYYRQLKNGDWSNASGCGNETASERYMMRKFIIESCKFWIHEYKIDGFRFDLMGIHDVETMNQISAELKKIDPSLFIYGEGWTAGKSPLPNSVRALKDNASKLNDVAVFSDDIRDGIKGSVFDLKSCGFVSGAKDLEETIKFGIVGSTYHPQIKYDLCNYSKEPWARNPGQSIGYVSCHDNNTLYDKLKISRAGATDDQIKRMHCMANTIILTSQNIPFLHAGVEFMRTKGGEHNSYNLPDEVNQINWNWKKQNEDVCNFYRGLIELRRNHPAFRMSTQEMLIKHLRFLELKQSGIVAFRISGNANGDSWKNIIVVYNATDELQEILLPPEPWHVALAGLNIDHSGSKKVEYKMEIPSISAMVVFQE